ncbi:AcrR family transcriptional regulator [Rhodococcus sp. 27YEA15]|uniref:TetR/AcrR family transcriptional regulator n=1 Tax=Rhodococcus sp. 27YEA15 TaxID=3156259 RepID=UPI003C7DED7D
MTTRRVRLGPEQRRAQLLDIGARLFTERAFEDVWIEEVAEIAGVSRGLMYHYFPNKRDFFAAIVERESHRLLHTTEPDESLPVREQIAAGLAAYIEYIAKNSRGVRAINVGALSADPAIRAIVDNELDAQQRRILDGLGLQGESRIVGAVAVRGWIAFVRTVCLDSQVQLSKDELHVLCMRTLTAAVGRALDS